MNLIGLTNVWSNCSRAEQFASFVDQELLKETFEDYQLMEDTQIGMEDGQ